MKRLPFSGALLCVLACAQAAEAQERWFALGYGVSFPTGETTDFTPGTSWGRFTIEARQLLDRRLSVGFSWSFTELSDEIDEILDFRQLGFPDIEDLAGNLSGNQFRTTNAMPLLLTAHYYPLGQWNTVAPYIGTGAGLTFNERRLNIGLTEFQEDAWGLALLPEVGLMWWMSEWMGLGLSGKYAFDFIDAFDVSYWNIDLAVAWQF